MASKSEPGLTQDELEQLLQQGGSVEQDEEPAPDSPPAEEAQEESAAVSALDQGAVDALMAQESEQTPKEQADAPHDGSQDLDQGAIEALFASQVQREAPPSKETTDAPSETSSPATSEPASVPLRPAQFAALIPPDQGRRARPGAPDLGILLDVPLRITVELGRAQLPVRDVLELAPGSVIQLDRSAGEVLDVLVNGVPVAHGEVVVVGEQFGIRLVRVLTSSGKDILQEAIGS